MALLALCAPLRPLLLDLSRALPACTTSCSFASVPESQSKAVQQQPPARPEEWTEVIDQKTGETYYWNQKTGETTDLGEPRPKTRFRKSSEEFVHEPAFQQQTSKEPPIEDRTMQYSFAGIALGIFLGWGTQFMH